MRRSETSRPAPPAIVLEMMDFLRGPDYQGSNRMYAGEALKITQQAMVQEQPRIASLVDGALGRIREAASSCYRQTVDPVEDRGVPATLVNSAYDILESLGYDVQHKHGRPGERFFEVSW